MVLTLKYSHFAPLSTFGGNSNVGVLAWPRYHKENLEGRIDFYLLNKCKVFTFSVVNIFDRSSEIREKMFLHRGIAWKRKRRLELDGNFMCL